MFKDQVSYQYRINSYILAYSMLINPLKGLEGSWGEGSCERIVYFVVTCYIMEEVKRNKEAGWGYWAL